ncbi:MAG: hypothetical protein MRJ96_08805 [Nitrospirales bacterium]|nr:hypothetical protein [Nitrospira sp.]MDR4501533.1 hypothetical protein [Nitrospirales bacterium]
MSDSIEQLVLATVLERKLSDHGFTDMPNGTFRPDATSWALIVLKGNAVHSQIFKEAGDRLIDYQMPDGRVVISPDHPDAYWPTPLAILAWHGSTAHQKALWQATDFLLRTTGVHWEKHEDDMVGHDTSIPGWPWIGQTHSWITPTAMSMLALSVAGYADHERVMAGVRLLLDRQISAGGWNYGNTSVLGQTLRPFPETTGIALYALAGRVKREAVRPSLEYLRARISTLRSPLSLGWALLGLGAWELMPHNGEEWICETLDRGTRYGGFDTASLCVLLLAALSVRGIEPWKTRTIAPAKADSF